MSRIFLACLFIFVSCVESPGQQAADGSVLDRQRMESKIEGVASQVKALDEPALRVFLRLQLATFLWGRKNELGAAGAETFAAEALSDLEANARQIPPLYVNLYRRELLALLETHAPSLAARVSKKESPQETASGKQQIDTAYAMLDSGDGGVKAVEKVSDLIKSGQEIGPMLLFFLHRLEKEHPGQLPRLLGEVLTAEMQKPDDAAAPNLLQLASFYLYGEVPPELKIRFLEAAVGVTRNGATWQNAKQLWDGYNLLRMVVPVVERLRPALHPRASAQLAALASLVPKSEIEREAAEERIRSSSDPLEEMINEANATRDASFKERLLVDAAKLALERGRLKVAADLVERAKSEGQGDFSYHDQFLGDVAAKAVERSDEESALYAAQKIKSPLRRATATSRVALALFKKRDLEGARGLLGSAMKMTGEVEDGAPKVAAQLQIISAYAKVDDERLPELARTVIKTINGITALKPRDAPGGEAHRKYVSELLQMAFHVIPAFRLLAEKDEVGAAGLADAIKAREVRAAAAFGALTGVRGSVAPPAVSSN